jgi:hypothetical protein
MDPNDQSQNSQDDQQAHNPAQDEPTQPLPQDGDTPFSEPSDVPGSDLPADAPPLDTNVEDEEVYDEGQAGAVEDNKPPEELQPPAV